MKQVRVITTDRTGHSVATMPAEEFAKTQTWDPRSLVVTVGGLQVNTVEEFLREIDQSTAEIPEVWRFPPMAGGI